ncbi:MAG: gamma-glutamyltransferase [Azospirillaceae bacterium]
MDGMVAVATPHPAATRAAAALLDEGAGAVEAGLAALAVLSVAAPHDCGLGGDLAALVAPPDGPPVGLDATGRAPAAATPARLRAAGHEAVPLYGPFSVTVPGAVAGWRALAERFAARPPAELLAPAIGLARDGVPVAGDLRTAIETCRDVLAADPAARSVFLDGVDADGLLRQPDLAATLHRLGEAGFADFHHGRLAADVAAGARQAGALISEADMGGATADFVAPLTLDRGGERIATLPPGLPGPALLAALNALEPTALAGLPEGSTRDYMAQIAAARAGCRALEAARAAGAAAAARNTVAVVTRDRAGGLAVLMQSLFHWFGAGVMAAGTGVMLQNRGAAFSLTPGRPDTLAHGRRPPHTLLPTLVTGPRRRLGLGVAGGAAQPQLVQQILAGLLDRGLDPAAALARPRWFTGVMDERGDCLHAEIADRQAVFDALAREGLAIAPAEPGIWYMGRAELVAEIDGVLWAETDPRGHGAARVRRARGDDDDG